VLKFDKLHDSVCEDNSWTDGKIFAKCFIKRSQTFFKFSPRFYVLTFFFKFLSERLVHLRYYLSHAINAFVTSDKKAMFRSGLCVRVQNNSKNYERI